MTLLETRPGDFCCVCGIQQQEKVVRRLEALGILEGTKVEVLNRKKTGATIIKVRGTRWALGEDIAAGIQVEEYDHE